MRVRLDYGTCGLEVDLPDDRVTVIEPHFKPAVPDVRAALLQAIRSPMGRPPLREVVRDGPRAVISVCDITRAQPRRETLQALFEEMPRVAAGGVTILIQIKADVLVKTCGLTPSEVRAAHFAAIEDVSRAVREAMERAGPAATLCVLPQGPQTIPYLV